MPGTVLRLVTRLNRGGPLRQLGALVPGLEALGWAGPVAHGRVPRGEDDGAAALAATGAELVSLPALRRGLAPGQDARALRDIVALIRRVRPDLIHTHMGKAGALGRIAAARTKVPVVHTLHGHHLERGRWTATAARWSERALARRTDALVALSPRQARDMVEVHRIAPAERVHVIGPGMDLAGFRERAAADPRPAALASTGVPRFLWTGRFVPVKNPRLLVEAVACAERPFHLTLLGDGPLRQSLRAEIRARGLAGRMSCPGSVSEVAPWLAAADGLVLCSESEGTPLSVIEAMALGVPVIVTTVGGLPDLVSHGQSGLWVAPRDAAGLARALDRLAEDPALRARLGAGGRRVADECFTATRLARETAALYEDLVGRG